MRIARHAERNGWKFPVLSDDPLMQFKIEEALVELVTQTDAYARQRSQQIADAHAKVQAELAGVTGGVR